MKSATKLVPTFAEFVYFLGVIQIFSIMELVIYCISLQMLLFVCSLVMAYKLVVQLFKAIKSSNMVAMKKFCALHTVLINSENVERWPFSLQRLSQLFITITVVINIDIV